jgi:PmbA protein
MKTDIFKEAVSDNAVETLLRSLKKRADSYEIYLSFDRGLVVEAKDGDVDSFKVRSNSGVGVRTIVRNRPGFAYSTVMTEEALEDMVSKALSGSSGATLDRFLNFPESIEPPVAEAEEPPDIFDPFIETIPEKEKIGTAIEVEKSARDFDEKVKTVRGAAYSESIKARRVVNSRGVDRTHSATFFSGSVMAMAENNGDSQMGFDVRLGHKMADVDANKIGNEAARRAVSALGARKIATQKGPAVFENTVVGEFLSALSSSFLSCNVNKGKSMLTGKTGKGVVSRKLNLWDDGLMPGGWASSRFDCEGVPRQRTLLVTGGVCRGFLYDTYWAAREGVSSTGNAVRMGFKGSPTVGASNIYIEKGEAPLEELLKTMDKGLFITEVMGAHTVDRVTGEFSLGAAGFWVEGGKIAYPVRGIAVSGTLLELFKRVEVVGSDMRFIASVGSPSLLFGEVEVSGG